MGKQVSKRISFSTYIIKIIAYVTMLIDHIGGKIYLPYLESIGQSYMEDPVYNWLRHIGRLAFVLFAFMIAEGMDKTHDKKKYIERLTIFALISEFPYDFSRGNYFDFSSQNVFFTLLGGAIAILLIKCIKENFSNKGIQICLGVIASLLMGIVCFFIQSDYGTWGVLLIIILYVTKGNKPLMLISGILMLSVGYYSYRIIVTALKISNFQRNTLLTWVQINQNVFLPNLTGELYGAVSLLLLCFYNGEKGRPISKKITYCFYPVHLLILGFLRFMLFNV